MYYLTLSCNTACMLLIIRFFSVRCIEKKSLFIVTSDPKTIFPIFFIMCMIFITSISSLKIINKDQQIIGKDFTMTFLGAFLPLFAQYGLVTYFFVVIKCLKCYTAMMIVERCERVSSRFAILSRICWMILPTSFIYSIMLLIGLSYPHSERLFATIYLVGNGINAWLYGAVTSLSLRCLLNELKSHVESFPDNSDDIRQVVRRLTYAYNVIASMSFMIGASYVLFGSFNYLLVRSTYLFIFQQLTCPPSSTVLILTVSRMSHIGDSAQSGSSVKLLGNHRKVVPSTPVDSIIKNITDDIITLPYSHTT